MMEDAILTSYTMSSMSSGIAVYDNKLKIFESFILISISIYFQFYKINKI